jgi:hypothetical protein
MTQFVKTGLPILGREKENLCGLVPKAVSSRRRC